MFALYVVNKHGSLLYQNDIVHRSQPSSTNDRIRWASTFHALSAMAAEISPVKSDSPKGIESVNFGDFVLHCKQTMTGMQFILIANSLVTGKMASEILTAVYQVYADYALKNPFYSMDMPIRLCGFNRGIRQVVATYQRNVPSIN